MAWAAPYSAGPAAGAARVTALGGSAAAAVSAVRDPAQYAGMIQSGAALSPLDWIRQVPYKTDQDY